MPESRRIWTTTRRAERTALVRVIPLREIPDGLQVSVKRETRAAVHAQRTFLLLIRFRSAGGFVALPAPALVLQARIACPGHRRDHDDDRDDRGACDCRRGRPPWFQMTSGESRCRYLSGLRGSAFARGAARDSHFPCLRSRECARNRRNLP